MDFEQVMNNLVAREYRQRYESLPMEVQKKLDVLKESNWKDYQLKVIKRKRIVPKKGDVFLVSPMENLYFCGVVVNDFVYADGTNFYVVLIFDTQIDDISQLPQTIEVDELLIRPMIVGRMYWTGGYFYNIDRNISIKKEIKYGFYDIFKDIFVDECRNPMKKTPEKYQAYGFSTISGVAYEINSELIIKGMK